MTELVGSRGSLENFEQQNSALPLILRPVPRFETCNSAPSQETIQFIDLTISFVSPLHVSNGPYTNISTLEDIF